MVDHIVVVLYECVSAPEILFSTYNPPLPRCLSLASLAAAVARAFVAPVCTCSLVAIGW